MKIYRVSYRRQEDHEHLGYEFYSNKRVAEKKQRQSNGKILDEEVEEFDFELSKAGVLSILNQLAGHPDNG